MKGKRLIAMVLAVVVALGSVCWKPPKAQAVFTEPAVALGCALLTSVIVGTTASLVFTDAVKENIGYAIDGLVTEYLDTIGDVAATTSDNFFSIIASGPKLLTTGAILLSKEAGELIGRFIVWLQTEKGLEAGGQSIIVSSSTGFNSDAGFLPVDIAPSASSLSDINEFANSFATWYPFGNDNGPLVSYSKYGLWYLDYNSVQVLTSNSGRTHYAIIYSPNFPDYVFFPVGYASSSCASGYYTDGRRDFFMSDLVSAGMDPTFYSDSFSLDTKSEFQTIPQEIPDGQAMVISGIDGITLDDPSADADAIFDAVLAGTLSPTVTVEDVATDIPATDTDTDTSILSWVKKIWQSVTDIPAAIADAVASIFVPSADFYPTAIANLKDAFSDRMGLLTYPISILFNFLDRMVNLSEQQPILRWGNIYLPGYAMPLVAAGQYNLNDAIGTSTGKQLHDIYLVIVDAIMILAFVDLCRRKYQKIIDN